MINLAPDEQAFVKILTSGDEISLEEKINDYLQESTHQSLVEVNVMQVEYHARTGSIDFGMIAVLVMKQKRGTATAQ